MKSSCTGYIKQDLRCNVTYSCLALTIYAATEVVGLDGEMVREVTAFYKSQKKSLFILIVFSWLLADEVT